MTAELVCSASDPAWLERRREGITATDIVTIAGLVTWDSPWALYHRKLGLLPEVEQSWRMKRGRWIEPGLAEHWAEAVMYAHPLRPGGLYRHSERIWQMATPDYLTYAGTAVLECKSTQIRDGWGPDGSDQVPRYVRAQVLWQMDTLGVSTGHVAADIAGEFRSYTIRHNPNDQDPGDNPHPCEACDEIGELRAQGLAFYRRMLTDSPPDLDGLEVTTDALRFLHPAPGGQVDLDPYLVSAYDGEAIALRDAKQAQQRFVNEIRQAMGDAHEATVDGRVVFRRTISKRAGYVVPPGETDTLRRIGKDKHDAD